MGKYKLIALDMDGTLLNDRSEISDENAAAIHAALAAGVTVCFSTGRGFRSALPYAEQLGLTTPMVTVNGGEIWLKPHELYKRSYLPAGTVARLWELAIAHDPWYWAYTTEQVYNKENWPGDAEQLEQYEWLKFGYHTEDDLVREQIAQQLREWGGMELTNSSPWNIEVNPLGVSKAAATEELCRLQGISVDQVIAVGDSLNDLAAIRAAGLGVAMGNAQEAVKEEADVITLTNNEHGVAHIIHKYILGEEQE